MSIDTTKFLANTSKLLDALHVFQFKPALEPKKEHYGSHIALTDFQFNNARIIQGLRDSIIDWVFSKPDAKRIFDEAYGPTCDLSAASATLYNSARETIRIAQPQGQFGELLLSFFLQHLFHAAPLLRKQPVRTSDNHERFGADAIHYKGTGGNEVYVGESKCYKSSYQFPSAFEESITSMEKTLSSFHIEIRKFVAGGFIEPGLKQVAEQLLSNKLQQVKLNPVSIIIYNETAKFTSTGPEIKEQIKNAVLHQCSKIMPAVYNDLEQLALSRFTYIIIPVWKLDALLDEFVNSI
ncbi:DUF1837 domain-containing protein [Rhodoferax sp. U11-2br]|uniref:HamA C-terminal domain-containing protein n=1 Tax=Rhodoferax sp. U11-2br TaxID=2838878 RepID=UPI001BE9C3A8|nr:DUF1837 domain-containing protein [Rhodoferax sp. U11-2br]MBT3068552.1 DUF1837 domain-containing protein [Rhodoferax sp. U11-2br]